MSTFIRVEGYRVLLEEEEEVTMKWKNGFVSAGLEKLGGWDEKGTMGNAYVLPKHKDITKSRPICPTFSEPTSKICRKMAKCLNRMMKLILESSHFNMGSVSELGRRLRTINNKVERRGAEWGVEGASFDIKDMFSRLPHAAILDALDWMCEWCEGRGFKSVQVRKQGTGTKLSYRKQEEGWWAVDFANVRRFVAFELEPTYTKATGAILKQVIGIPMGKSSSPPLACILCMKAEYEFISTLGDKRNRVFGMRLMDDVSIFVARKKDGDDYGKEIIGRFGGCYDEELTLKRTDDEEGVWEFLGCKLTIEAEQPYLGCFQRNKNMAEIWQNKPCSKQSRTSVRGPAGGKKSVVITGELNRIYVNTTRQEELLPLVLTLKRELRGKGYPPEFFNNGLRRFAANKDEIWKLMVELMTTW
ncbi:hypothetical protein CBR_g12466 [Chara braunii]|uniref:Reverse transcriptase domain-containing protein n=1 Tax=Chara braunii TaxID=69332 RepID=A0A388JSE0_CHABU|nr:hypothetical protein CBR_g12466 [Chara braunii]|eukprot:GBG60728.1 hypothetical protein CBR_g12466 [Chara braunii]